jgi:hypothetical protein
VRVFKYFHELGRQKGAKYVTVVVGCFFLVELVVHGGIAHFLIVHGRKSNYLFFILFLFLIYLSFLFAIFSP